MTFKNVHLVTIGLVASFMLVACTTAQTADACSVSLNSSLAGSIRVVEDKLFEGCTYSFENYFEQLMEIAVNNPDPDNKRQFSDFLVRISEQGVISKRQAKAKYNRYFNVKFVSWTGEYNTCSQTCPVKSRVLAEMQSELLDKELGLVRASEDATSYYRADHLLKEAQLVLEATCRACEAGNL
ncbi:MAG: hypothetical protein IIB71_01415 [Proteobacteria bacterium]|nr:hypothetical protein [Pseudomonadota bacterium]